MTLSVNWMRKFNTIPMEMSSKQEFLELTSISCAKTLPNYLTEDQAVLLSTVYDNLVHEIECNVTQRKLNICNEDIPGCGFYLDNIKA